MSMFADARNDDVYNVDFLNEKDAEFIRGYDYAIELLRNFITGNLDTYEDDLNNVFDAEIMIEPDEDEVYSTREDLFEILSDNAELISLVCESNLECERDMLVTSMIEAMDDDEFKTNRMKAFESDKEYYDTIHYAVTGKKRIREC